MNKEDLFSHNYSMPRRGNLFSNDNKMRVNGSLKTYHRKNLENLLDINKMLNNNPSLYSFKETETEKNKDGPSSFLEYHSHIRKRSHKKKQDIINANVVTSNASLTAINNVNEFSITPNPGEQRDNTVDNNTKYLTYYDVKHPKTKKTIDRNKGTITTTTDMGAVIKTTLTDPSNLGSYNEIEHKLDNEFKDSDRVVYNRSAPINPDAYFRPMGSLGPTMGSGTRGSVSIDPDSSGNNLKMNYNYDTTIDVASPNQYHIKRVHTNNPPGVTVNTEPYNYGKTLNTYSSESVYGSSSSQRQKCCLIEPCFYLPKCESGSVSRKKNDRFSSAYLSSFLQTKEHHKLKNSHKKKSSEKTETEDTETVIEKNEKKLTQRNQIRKRSRFPDPQWKCTQKNIEEALNYLCDQEISISFIKYCKPIREQINVLIESMLYQDTLIDICMKINMCELNK